MKSYSLVLLIFLNLGACSTKKIEITTDYIINPEWTKQNEKVGANSIKIKRLYVKNDSVLNPFSDLNQEELLSKLDFDSSFDFFANVVIKPSEVYETKKIYFNRENDFYWLRDKYGNQKVKTIGKLEPKNWYEISNIYHYSFFVYIDSLNNVHRYVINQANY